MKTRKMKLFESAQKNFAVLGISSYYSTQKYHLNMRNVTVALLVIVDMLANGAYNFYRDRSFAEYLENIYVTTSLAVGLTIFIISIVLMPKIFMVIDSLEQTINKSE